MKKSRPKTSRLSIEFPYGVRRDKAGWRFFPAVEAEIVTETGVVPVRFLLDSGADCTMLPKTIGELIGLNFNHLPKITVTGVEGSGISAWKATVRLRIGRLKLPPIPCLYTVSDRTPLLLGREGFFDLFNIAFDNRNKKLVLTQLF